MDTGLDDRPTVFEATDWVSGKVFSGPLKSYRDSRRPCRSRFRSQAHTTPSRPPEYLQRSEHKFVFCIVPAYSMDCSESTARPLTPRRWPPSAFAWRGRTVCSVSHIHGLEYRTQAVTIRDAISQLLLRFTIHDFCMPGVACHAHSLTGGPLRRFLKPMCYFMKRDTRVGAA